MSPFSQLSSPTTGYGGGIDRDFSPILNYLDEFDRHFSRRHRFVNCFIPRFDLEEDENNYYLYGDIPGAVATDINIEAHDNHTLVIWGKTQRTGPDIKGEGEGGQAGDETAEGEFVKVQVEDHEHGVTSPGVGAQGTTEGAGVERRDNDEKASKTEDIPPALATSPLPAQPTTADAADPTPDGHIHHQRHPTIAQRFLSNAQPSASSYTPASGHHILLSERLVGDFHRTFAFPSPVNEEGVQASMENGVLSLVIPKREPGTQKRGKKIPIVHGRWWKGEDRGSGFGFAGGAV